MGKVDCDNLEIVLTKMRFKPPSIPKPEPREMGEKDIKVAKEWWNSITDEELWDPTTPITDDSEQLFNIAKERWGDIDPEDVDPLRKAAREVMEEQVYRAIETCRLSKKPPKKPEAAKKQAEERKEAGIPTSEEIAKAAKEHPPKRSKLSAHEAAEVKREAAKK